MLLVELDAVAALVEVAVMVDRQHKAFPVQTTYVGLELSTTLGDNVQVYLNREEEYAELLKRNV